MTTRWTARRWASEYARAYHDASAWLASWCPPWSWVHGFWRTTRDLRLYCSRHPGEPASPVMPLLLYSLVACLSVLAAGLAVALGGAGAS